MKPILYLLFIILLGSCSKFMENIPLKEHPRPDFKRELWQNLNGKWLFAQDTANVGETEDWQNMGEFFKEKITVPFSWASSLSGIKNPNLMVGWYYKEFSIKKKKKWDSKNTCLVIGASDFHTKVWVNGNYLGEHFGGYTPFDFNISHALKNGDNEIVIRVEDEELNNRPSGKQYYGNAKGIWQTVYLESRSDNYIKSIKFYPDIDKKEVTVKVDLFDEAKEGLNLNIIGKKDNINFSVQIPQDSNTTEVTIPIEILTLWTLDNPYLYEVTASVNGENVDDKVDSYFGMRKISTIDVPGKDFSYVALNNEPIYLKLALDQSYHPDGFYTFPSDEFMKEEIQRAKDLGLNGLRVHIKAEIPRKLYWADKLGVLIQEDIPNFWGEPTKEAKANWEYTALQEIERDFNHPSIFSWVLFNETWGLFSTDSLGKRSYAPETQEWVRECYHKAKSIDPTRLVEDNSPCNWDHVITDINTWHRYSPAKHWAGFLDEIIEKTYTGSSFNYIGENKQASQPMFNSECGAVWGYNGSTGDIDITWEYHIMMNEFRKRPKIAGFLFTEFHDVINEWNGYYRFDRRLKEFGLDELCHGMVMEDFHKDIYVIPGEDFYQSYNSGTTIEMPIGISCVTNNIPEKLTVEYSLYGWDGIGEKFESAKGEIDGIVKPFEYTELLPVHLKLPAKHATMIFSTKLKDGKGKVLHQNFVPFKVVGKENINNTITKSPSDFQQATWNIKHATPQNGKKVWGMGSGYFEYEFEITEDIDVETIDELEFRAELASRYPQAKYLEEEEAERIGMTIVSEKGIDPGYGKNSYPQTDERKHSSLVKITANDQKIAEVELADDPADHRGILSWMNQEPGWEWESDDKSKPWLLDEAGSYGYLVVAELDETSKKSALESGKITIRLHVDESSVARGGLSVYGKESGRFPLDPTIILKYKH